MLHILRLSFMEGGCVMSTDSSTLQSTSPTSGRGSKQRPRRWLRVILILLIVAIVLLATFGLAWQFLVSPQLTCSQATNPTHTGAVSEYCLPGNERNYGAMVVGPDGNLWFTDSGKIGRITTHGVITEFAVPNPPTAIPLPGIAQGPDGNLWYIAGTTLGRITPQGHAIGAVTMPPRVRYITGLTTAPDRTLWVGLSTASETDQLTHEIAKVTASGEVTAFALPGPVAPTGGLVAGADGNLWVAATDTSIGRITPNGHFLEFPVVIKNPPLVELTPGPDGNIWFIDYAGGVGKITSAGDFTIFNTAEQANGFTSIGDGPDGNVWFSTGSNTINRITPSGVVTRFTLPHNGDVTAITSGSDGGVWFMQVSSNVVPFLVSSTKIVRVTP
jgi:streptogramin lyase